MRKTTFALAILAIALPLAAQPDFSKVEVKATKVAGSVYMLTGAGGNIGVSVGDDGIVVVDDQYAPLAEKIRAALKGITDKPVRFVLNTHYHGDHTGGNEAFGKEGTPIIAHDNVRGRLAAGTTRRGTATPPAPKSALPIVTFNDKLTVHLNGEEVRAVHFPAGHTDGDSVIYFTKSNVVHMGDDYFNGFYPFVDRENGGSVQGLIRNIEKVLAGLPADAKVIPGHGPLSDKTGLGNFLQVLKETWAAVEKAHKAGKSAEQMKSDKILDKWDAQWGQGFIKTNTWIDAIAAELAAKKN